MVLSKSLRKRYILFVQNSEPTREAREKFARLIVMRHPELSRKALIWVAGGLIIKTDHRMASQVRESVSGMQLDGISLTSRLSSGSISKLKRVAGEQAAG